MKPNIVSGLSIGAYPASVIAGALDFSDALRLVVLRGALMKQAYPQDYGLTLSRLEKLLTDSNTYIANLNNAETQIVIAGRDEDMARVAQKALDAGTSDGLIPACTKLIIEKMSFTLVIIFG